MALSEAQMKMVNEVELEMMAEMMEMMYNRMTSACQKKCIPPEYKDPTLTKGEAVCLDRCVAKYMEVHDRLGKQLSETKQQDAAKMKQLQTDLQKPQSPV